MVSQCVTMVDHLVFFVFCRELEVEMMATDSDSEFQDAAQTAITDVTDTQLTQLQEQLVATMIENENIS